MKLLSLAILLSLLFIGVVEAGDLVIVKKVEGQVVPCENVEIPNWRGDCTAASKPLGSVRAEGRSGNEQARAAYGVSAAPSPKKVVFDYDDVIRIMADKEHREKLLNQCTAERAILLKLKDEQGKTISIQADQVKGLIETAETQERLGATEAQINEALQKQLSKVTQDLGTEKRLSRYKSEAIWLGVVGAIVLWVVN